MGKNIINLLLWLTQFLVASMFFFAFYAKVVQPVEETVKMMPWVADQPGLALFTGVLDLLAALGLLLPALLRIQPRLTSLAAAGGFLLVLAGLGFHAMRGEMEVIGFNVVLLAALAFIYWGRTKKSPIQPR